MSQPLPKKRPLLSPRARVIVALAIIALLVVLAFFLPPEGGSTNVTGDTIPSTPAVTNFVSTMAVNRSVDFNNVHFTITQVTQAAAFSDDRKQAGAYTVRVEMQARSDSNSQAIGIDYLSLARLLLPGGQAIQPKLISIAPLVVPNQTQSGYIDFPVNTRVDLSSLMLRLGQSTVAFSS